MNSKPQDGARRPKRPNAIRLSLALEQDVYMRLRLFAARNSETHQDIIESAVIEYLNNHDQ